VTNTESFDRICPIKFLPIKLRIKLELKIGLCQEAELKKAITFEFSHFMSPTISLSSQSQAICYNRYQEYRIKVQFLLKGDEDFICGMAEKYKKELLTVVFHFGWKNHWIRNLELFTCLDDLQVYDTDKLSSCSTSSLFFAMLYNKVEKKPWVLNSACMGWIPGGVRTTMVTMIGILA